MACLRYVVFQVCDGSIDRHLGPQNNERVMLKPAVPGSVIAAVHKFSISMKRHHLPNVVYKHIVPQRQLAVYTPHCSMAVLYSTSGDTGNADINAHIRELQVYK